MNKQILIILTAFSFWSIKGVEGLGSDILPLAALLANVQLEVPAQRQLTSDQQRKKQEKDRKRQLKKAEQEALKAQRKASQANCKGQQTSRNHHSRGAAGSWYKK